MRGCGRIARPAFPAPSSRLRDEPSGTTRAHSCRENAEVWVSFSRATFCRLQPFARLHPSPVFVGRVAHRERSDTMCRVGACPRERILTSPPPRPPLRCGRPSPLKGSLRNPSFVIHCWWIESGAEDGGSRSVESFGSTGFSKSRAQRDARPLDQGREVVPVREAAFTPQAGGCRPATL